MIDALIFGGTHFYMSSKAYAREPANMNFERHSVPVEDPPTLEEVFIFGVILSGFAGATTSALTWGIAITISVLAHTARTDWWGPVHTGFLTGTMFASPIFILQVITGSYGVVGTDIATYGVFSVLFGLGMFMGTRRGYYRYDKAVVEPLNHLPNWNSNRYRTAGVSTNNGQTTEWLTEDDDTQETEPPEIDTEANLEELRVDPEDHPLKDTPEAESESESKSNNTAETDDTGPQEHSVEQSNKDTTNPSEQHNEPRSDRENKANSQSESSSDPMEKADTANEDNLIEEYETNWKSPPDQEFSDIGGYDEVKQSLKSDIIQPLKSDNPGFDRFGIEPDRGILLHGPPGTGKTMFARSLANALDRPFVELDQAQLTSKWINESPQIIQRVFEEAQELGGVVFIDEVENLVKDRGQSANSHAEDDKVVTTFLTYLTKDDQNFIVIMTTNAKEMIDDAMLRPGRLDVKQEVGLPGKKARAEIFQVNLEDVPHTLSRDTITGLVDETEGWSGADIELLVRRAKRKAAEENAKALSRKDMVTALNDAKNDVTNKS